MVHRGSQEDTNPAEDHKCKQSADMDPTLCVGRVMLVSVSAVGETCEGKGKPSLHKFHVSVCMSEHWRLTDRVEVEKTVVFITPTHPLFQTWSCFTWFRQLPLILNLPHYISHTLFWTTLRNGLSFREALHLHPSNMILQVIDAIYHVVLDEVC